MHYITLHYMLHYAQCDSCDNSKATIIGLFNRFLSHTDQPFTGRPCLLQWQTSTLGKPPAWPEHACDARTVTVRSTSHARSTPETTSTIVSRPKLTSTSQASHACCIGEVHASCALAARLSVAHAAQKVAHSPASTRQQQQKL
jgi:hypothetical protein